MGNLLYIFNNFISTKKNFSFFFHIIKFRFRYFFFLKKKTTKTPKMVKNIENCSYVFNTKYIINLLIALKGSKCTL